MEGKINDATKAPTNIAPRNRPSFLLLPYITHTLSISPTANIRSGVYPHIIWSNILSTQAKLAYLSSQRRENVQPQTYKKESSTYNVQVPREVTDFTQRPISILKQELYEVKDETQWAYVSILR